MQIKGQIESIAESRTHEEPGVILDLGQRDGGLSLDLNLTFKNTGNVDQTVTLNSLSNFINCSLSVSGRFMYAGDVLTPDPNVALVTPGQSCYFVFTIQLDEFPIGTPLTDFSLDADWSWS